MVFLFFFDQIYGLSLKCVIFNYLRNREEKLEASRTRVYIPEQAEVFFKFFFI